MIYHHRKHISFPASLVPVKAFIRHWYLELELYSSIGLGKLRMDWKEMNKQINCKIRVYREVVKLSSRDSIEVWKTKDNPKLYK